MRATLARSPELAGAVTTVEVIDPTMVRVSGDAVGNQVSLGRVPEDRVQQSLQRIGRTKAIIEDSLPLDLDHLKALSDEIVKLNSKLNYVYGGTVK